MDTMTKAVIFGGTIPLPVNGRQYDIRPLSVKEITSDEFATSGLYCPDENEPPANWQAIYLEDEHYRQQLDRWLSRLLSFEGQPMSLQGIIDHRWTDADLGRFLLLVLQSSGLSRADEKQDAKRTTAEDWIDIISELQYRGHMGWAELLDMPLLRLNAIRERVLKQAAQDAANSMNGLLGAIPGGTKAQAQAPQKKATSLLGDMPQFETKEEYFAWRKERGLD